VVITAVIMVVRGLWVEWVEVNSVEVWEDRAAVLTAVAEALVVGRRSCCSSIVASYRVHNEMPIVSVCVRDDSICKCPGINPTRVTV
jgi:hypothetical protein